MKAAFSPIEVWHTEPNLRSVLKRFKIVNESKTGVVTIPTFKCIVEKGDTKQMRAYPFYHQKLMFMLEAAGGDYNEALNLFDENGKKFMCGKNLEILVSLA